MTQYEILTSGLQQACALVHQNYVGIRGNPHAPICVAGEAPGADEDQQGLPFVGASGREQDRMLRSAGLTLDQVWLTNPYKIRPPNNDLSSLPDLGIPLDIFERQFFEELREYKPAIIIAAGATPMRLLCPQTAVKQGNRITYPISKWRGSLLTSPLLLWPHYVVPVQHPAFVLREWSERQVSVMIYERAREEYEYFYKNGILQPLPVRQIITAPSYDLAYEYLSDILVKPKSPVAVDIEVLWRRANKQLDLKSRRAVYTIALARSALDAIAFCLWDYSVEQTTKLFGLLHRILTTIRQIGQNYTSFDSHWLGTIGLRPNELLVSDTLIRHHVLWIEMEHTLAFQTMQYTREPYYKDEGHQWWAGADKRILLNYNGKDAAVDFEIHERQEGELNG